ncbi:Arf guanine-nucleotide exchange factor gnom [Thalictrum thalictroides]|uniref:Arf guanine-nucleotide exchange factor gnom n=1 Tax=Thalictrum thalictroides TaxID=46969 RepID=A0A7J6VFI4_THATH|nr:Arf guanine-nucleotide exchange factor gnom [Thalictrum thalictroides]
MMSFVFKCSMNLLALLIFKRLFLETFCLPGESQKIQRVLESFLERDYVRSPHILVNKDAAFVLFYSIIMLNTDQHSVQLARALIWAAGRPQKGNTSPEDEDTAVFCLELLIGITINNFDRIILLWQGVYEYICSIVKSTVMPCALVEKAVFGLLRICQQLLPYKENLAVELPSSLQLVLKLDARVADAYC